MVVYPRHPRPRITPAERRTATIIGNTVAEVETRRVGEAIWVAIGRMSEPMPTGPYLKSPIEVTATGRTEQLAIDELKRRIEATCRTGNA